MVQAECTTLVGVTLTGAQGVETLTHGDVQESFEWEPRLVLTCVNLLLGLKFMQDDPLDVKKLICPFLVNAAICFPNCLSQST